LEVFMRTFRRLSFVALALAMPAALFVACSDSTSSEDGGTEEDASSGRDARADTGVRDSAADSSRPDTSVPADANTPDTSVSDAGADASDAARDASDAGRDASDGSVGDGGDGGDATIDAGPGASFMVLRVGDGVAALSAAAAPVFLEERRSGDGAIARTINLPIAVNGANQPITIAGNSTTEGALTISGNGQYVSLAGYGAIPGTAAVNGTASAATNRVVARVDKNAVIDTTTRLDAAFTAVSVRSAVTDDGNTYWVSGENAAGDLGGVYYLPLGTTGGTQILAAPQNMRVLGIFGGQLYGNTQSGAGGNTLRLFSIGMNLPVTAGQTGTNLAGITAANTTPNGFVILDLDAAVAGLDTMYVADTRSIAGAGAGGVQKWTYNGATWALAATFKNGLTGSPINVAATKVGAVVHIVATTLDNPAKVVRFIDDGGANPLGVTLATAGTNTQFRGIAVSPL